MRLPENLEQQSRQDIQALERAQTMRCIASLERIGRRIGKKKDAFEGKADMLAMLLSKRFGPLGEDTRVRLERANAAQLQRWAERVLDATILGEVLDEP